MRIACLRVPSLPLAALLRAEPQLTHTPLAVSQGEGPRASVLASSGPARRAGVRSGMTVVQARSLFPGLEIRPSLAAHVRSAQGALMDVARAFSPRVELGPRGEVFLDVAGLEHHFASEASLGRSIQRAALKVGLSVLVGIGAGLLVARLAALTLSEPEVCLVVAAGRERVFLSPLPVSLLESSARVQTALERFGIETLGQLAAMPGPGLGRRLGAEGLRLWRQARGQERDPFVADPARELFVEEGDPGWAIGQLEALMHEIQKLLQRLAERLSCRGLCAQSLALTLRLEPEGRDERLLELAAPTARTESWTRVIRLALEEQAPRAPVAGLAVQAHIVPQRMGQMDFFSGAAHERSARLDDTLARLSALAGEGRVGSPCRVDSHRPEDFTVEPLGQGRSFNDSASPLDQPPLHALRPPRPARVQLARKRPVHVRADGLCGPVLRAAGPWRLQGGWWKSEPLNRDYYDVELTHGGLIRIFMERDSGRWFMDGVCG